MNPNRDIDDPDTVGQLIEKEVKRKYVIGSFTSSFTVFRASPIGVATGKYSGKKRLILDLSAPLGRPTSKRQQPHST